MRLYLHLMIIGLIALSAESSHDGLSENPSTEKDMMKWLRNIEGHKLGDNGGL